LGQPFFGKKVTFLGYFPLQNQQVSRAGTVTKSVTSSPNVAFMQHQQNNGLKLLFPVDHLARSATV
jgi:hypothetical protein